MNKKRSIDVYTLLKDEELAAVRAGTATPVEYGDDDIPELGPGDGGG